ncbi:phosphoglycolate phosphatase [Limnobacter sp.]|uniref:phosphoglycolate phosphatase n=1 Tax=Limnobacter sp. TaxID=2003368 RepID=UPI003511548B
MTTRAVLFDLDGTLLHTVPDLAAAVNAMLRDLGRPALSESQVGIYIGKGAENLVHRSLTGSMTERASAEEYEHAMRIWQQHYTTINGQNAVLYPGVVEGLDALRQAGVPMAVVTNKPERFTQPLLQRTGLASYFSVVVGGDTCPEKKPSPMPVLHACKQLDVQPESALMIGDSHNDAEAAHAAGAPCWLLPYGYNEGMPVQSTPCQAYIQTIAQAADRLLGGRVQA